jgi:hypothetical protein
MIDAVKSGILHIEEMYRRSHHQEVFQSYHIGFKFFLTNDPVAFFLQESLGMRKDKVLFVSNIFPCVEWLIIQMLSRHAGLRFSDVYMGSVRDKDWPLLINAAGDLSNLNSAFLYAPTVQSVDLVEICKKNSDYQCIVFALQMPILRTNEELAREFHQSCPNQKIVMKIYNSAEA